MSPFKRVWLISLLSYPDTFSNSPTFLPNVLLQYSRLTLCIHFAAQLKLSSLIFLTSLCLPSTLPTFCSKTSQFTLVLPLTFLGFSMFANVKYPLHFVKYVLHFLQIFSEAGWLKTGLHHKSSATKALDKLGENGFFRKFRKQPLFLLAFFRQPRNQSV